MNTELFFSCQTDQWETPQDFFDKLNEEFRFTLDPCADESNHKCERYFTKEQDGLKHDWSGETVFCNPPYGRKVGKWVEKCFREVYAGDCKCAVLLLFANTDMLSPARTVESSLRPIMNTQDSAVTLAPIRQGCAGSRKPGMAASALITKR